jgi:alcohol dehydrogenase
MGARSVVAPGRNEAVLSDLKRRFGDRLVPVRLVGDADYDSEAMKHAAPAPIDAVGCWRMRLMRGMRQSSACGRLAY